MRALWTEDRVNFDGEYYSTVDASIYDRPETPIPIYIAAGGPMVARYAGRAGDGFICTSGKVPPSTEDELLPAVAEGAEKAGKRPRRRRPDDRDQALPRHRPRHRAGEHPLLGAARALARSRSTTSPTRSRWRRRPDALPIEQIAIPLDRRQRPRQGRRRHQAVHRTAASTTSSSTHPATTSAASWNSSNATSPHAYARQLARVRNAGRSPRTPLIIGCRPRASGFSRISGESASARVRRPRGQPCTDPRVAVGAIEVHEAGPTADRRCRMPPRRGRAGRLVPHPRTPPPPAGREASRQGMSLMPSPNAIEHADLVG